MVEKDDCGSQQGEQNLEEAVWPHKPKWAVRMEAFPKEGKTGRERLVGQGNVDPPW